LYIYRQRSLSNSLQGHTNFYHISLKGWRNEVDGRNAFGDNATMLHLQTAEDSRFLVNPLQHAPTKQGATGVQVRGLYQLSCKKSHDCYE
jgi:hypothetical protein